MKNIKEFEGLYSACKNGKIWGHRQKKFLKPWLIGHGYEAVSLYRKPRKNEKFLVHRLIAQTFIPNPNNLREVNHKNSNRLDNRPQNLEWVTSKENKQHAIRLGLYKNLGKNPARGSKQGLSKLSEKQVIEIRTLRKKGISGKKIAKDFGVSDTSIYLIANRITWKHI